MTFDASATTELTKNGKTSTVAVGICVEGPSKMDPKLSVKGGQGEWTVKFSLFDQVLNNGRREAKSGNVTVSRDGDKVKVAIGNIVLRMPKDYMEQVARTLKSLRNVPANDPQWDGGMLPDTFA